jgi:DNA helicase HerA-like ATPase
VFEEKQGQGREPLRFVVLDELNKYAPREGTSPIKDLLVDIAARGRSLGVLLIGAQQSAGDVEPAVVRNASVKVVGRLDAGESAEYRFLSPELRERAARFLPGTMILDQPLIPAPIPIRFPFPAFATNVAEAAAADPEAEATEVAEIFRSL